MLLKKLIFGLVFLDCYLKLGLHGLKSVLKSFNFVFLMKESYLVELLHLPLFSHEFQLLDIGIVHGFFCRPTM